MARTKYTLDGGERVYVESRGKPRISQQCGIQYTYDVENAKYPRLCRAVHFWTGDNGPLSCSPDHIELTHIQMVEAAKMHHKALGREKCKW